MLINLTVEKADGSEGKKGKQESVTKGWRVV